MDPGCLTRTVISTVHSPYAGANDEPWMELAWCKRRMDSEFQWLKAMKMRSGQKEGAGEKQEGCGKGLTS